MIIKQILLLIIVIAHCICILGLTNSNELIQTQQDDQKKIEDAISLIHYHLAGEWKEISLDSDKAQKRQVLEESKESADVFLSKSCDPFQLEKSPSSVVSRRFFLGESYYPDKMVTTVRENSGNKEFTIIESLGWYIFIIEAPKNMEKSEDYLFQIVKNSSEIAELTKADFVEGYLEPCFVVFQAKQEDAIMMMVRKRDPDDKGRNCLRSRILWHKATLYYCFFKGKFGIDWGDYFFRERVSFPHRNFCFGF